MKNLRLLFCLTSIALLPVAALFAGTSKNLENEQDKIGRSIENWNGLKLEMEEILERSNELSSVKINLE